MIAADRFPHQQRLDEPWRRLPWLTPSALLVWALLLSGFAVLLESARQPPESVERLDARLLDIPAEAPAGLQGGPGAEPEAPAPPAPVPPPPPHVEPKREPAPVPRVKSKPAPPPVSDARGAYTLPPAAVDGAATEQPPAAAGSVATGRAASGRGGGGGLGSDSLGAHAVYAPAPKIPDDLREEVFETVAVAHFHVTFDGNATVTLTKPTTNPRLNSLLLDTLQQWRFLPAVRNGVAIDSAFDVRIPIAVQ
jgi:periplasmic protein TonB